MNSIKTKVENCMAKYERTRSSDKALINSVIYEYYRDKIDENGKISLLDLYEIPSFESITRCRRKIQEEGKYLATKEVMIQRGWNELKWLKFVQS